MYEELREAVRSMRLPPGVLLSEPAVASCLAVNRAPVREAFTRLAQQELITIVPQVSSRVAVISLSGVENAVFIRNALEKLAFEQAIAVEHIDTTDLQVLVDRNRAAALHGDADEFFESDEQLHQLIFEMAGASRMWDAVRSTKVQLDRLRQLNLGASMANAEVVAKRQRIVDALNTRDAGAGAQIIHTHSHRALTDTARLRQKYPDFFLA